MSEKIDSSNCPVKCLERPDAVEKINWRCVECMTELKDAYDALMIKREEEIKARVIEDAKREEPVLNDEEINKRREMYKLE